MAFTVIDYGSETPESIDRFGLNQEYGIFGVNGRQRISAWVQPVRSGFRRARRTERPKEPRSFWWSFNSYTKHAVYRVLTRCQRDVSINQCADGRVTISLDGEVVYEEKRRVRQRNGRKVPEIDKEISRWVRNEESKEEFEARMDPVRAAQEERRSKLAASQQAQGTNPAGSLL